MVALWCSYWHSSVVVLPVGRMVIVTAWLVCTYLHRILRREQGKVTREQRLARLDMVVQGDISAVRTDIDTDIDTDNKESELYQELQSVKAVIEIRSEEVRRLRRELDRREGWREEKGTMTEEMGDELSER